MMPWYWSKPKRGPALVYAGVAAALLVVSPLPAPAQAGPAAPDPGAAVLLPGDVVRVQVWREPDLGGDFQIDEDGIVTLPLLGRVPVAGMPVRELRDRLLEEYARELRNPAIQVSFYRRVHVLGEVYEPGLISVDLTLSLAGAVALAGGATPDGDLRKLTIIRDGVALDAQVGPELNLVAIGLRSGDQILVGRRPWWDRHSGILASGLLGVLTVIAVTVR